MLEGWIRRQEEEGNSPASQIGRALKGAFGDFPLEENSEAKLEVKSFSAEARKALEKKGYRIYSLSGTSIANLRAKGNRFSSTWHEGNDFEKETTEACEVAINPHQLFLADSNRKTLGEQEKMVASFSNDLSRKIKGVKAIIGEANQYAEVAFIHFKLTGERLFGEKSRYNYARTKTYTGDGSRVANVGRFGADGLHVADWGTGGGCRGLGFSSGSASLSLGFRFFGNFEFLCLCFFESFARIISIGNASLEYNFNFAYF